MFARFARRFEYEDPKLGKITFPRGWAGELDEDVHRVALARRSLVEDKSEELTSVHPPKSDDGKADALLSAKAGVANLKAKVAASSGDEKEAAVSELKAALAELNALRKS